MLLDQIQQISIPRMSAKGIEVGVVFHPALKLWTTTRKRTFQQIESQFDIAQFRVAACYIIQILGIVRVDRQCSGDPFPGTLRTKGGHRDSPVHPAGRPRWPVMRVNDGDVADRVEAIELRKI